MRFKTFLRLFGKSIARVIKSRFWGVWQAVAMVSVTSVICIMPEARSRTESDAVLSKMTRKSRKNPSKKYVEKVFLISRKISKMFHKKILSVKSGVGKNHESKIFTNISLVLKSALSKFHKHQITLFCVVSPGFSFTGAPVLFFRSSWLFLSFFFLW